jgi:hypothetical protein
VHHDIDAILLPALKAILSPDEVDSIAIWRSDDAVSGANTTSVGSGRRFDMVPIVIGRPLQELGDVGTSIHVVVRGESFRDLLRDERATAGTSDAELVERLVGNLQDFVAESEFSWGQWREPRPDVTDS